MGKGLEQSGGDWGAQECEGQPIWMKFFTTDDPNFRLQFVVKTPSPGLPPVKTPEDITQEVEADAEEVLKEQV